MLENALRMGIPGVRSMCFIRRGPLVSKLLKFVFGMGVGTGDSELGNSQCSVMKKRHKYTWNGDASPPPSQGPSNRCPLPSLGRAQPQAKLPL